MKEKWAISFTEPQSAARFSVRRTHPMSYERHSEDFHLFTILTGAGTSGNGSLHFTSDVAPPPL